MLALAGRVEFGCRSLDQEIGLPSFGEKLRLEREKRNITLDQVSVSTKIGLRMLRALEENQFNQLPGGIFNKGFVRAYARVVGLDEEQTIADYLQASGDAAPPSTEVVVSPSAASRSEKPQRNEKPQKERTDHHKSRPEVARRGEGSEAEESAVRIDASSGGVGQQLPWGVFAALLLLVALTLSLWSRYERSSKRQSSSSPSSPSEPADRGPADAASAPSAPQRSTTQLTPVSNSPPASASPSTQFSLLIKAHDDSWITITSDGKAIPSELMLAGTERTIRGTKQIIVRAGNAGGLDFQLNGEKVPIVGESGEVKTVIFGPRGIVKE
jgi:cytoskeleton protein RodZ